MATCVSYKPMPLVARFIAAFEDLTPMERHKAIGEMAGFCVGYREGLGPTEILPVQFVEDDDLDTASPGEPEQYDANLTGVTVIAEMMTDAHVLPHRGDEGGSAPPPKGWS
jgi:hypothetical protein